jgi:CxxC motif-containing protein (DUF1111 family)
LFHPYSDFLIHDMGALGDHIGLYAGEAQALTRNSTYSTAPHQDR